MNRYLTLICILLSFSSVQGQWSKKPTSASTRPTQLFEMGGKIMVSDDYGLAYSVNNGKNWTRTNTQFRLAQCLVDGNLLYGITYESTLIRSDDEGESWDTIANLGTKWPARMLKTGNFIYYMTQNPNTVQVFNLLTNQLTELGSFSSIFSDYQYAYELKSIGDYVFFASDWGLIRYSNGGTQIDTLSNSKVSMLAVRGDTLFEHTQYDLNYSLDFGETWTLIQEDSNLDYLFMQRIYFKGNRSFVLGMASQNSCTEATIWETNSTFTQATRKLKLGSVCISDIFLSSNGTLIVATDYEILTLDPADQNWAINNTGLKSIGYPVVQQDDLLISTYLISKDTGETWSAPFFGDVSYYLINSIVKKDSFYYAAVYYRGLARSTDFKHWETLVDWVPHINKVGDTLMTATADRRIQLSTNGINWITTSNRLQQAHFPPEQIYGNLIYDLRYDSDFGKWIFRSTFDLGETWYTPGTGFLESNVEELVDISVWKSDVYLLAQNPQTQEKKIYGSHDYGHNWQSIPLPANNYLTSNRQFVGADNLLFLTDLETIWVTTNDGEAWTEVDRDTISGTIQEINIAFDKLWVSTDIGLWARDLNGIDLEVYRGTVFNDENLNALQDIGELGIPNTLLQVSNRDWTVVTDSIGRYEIRAELINDSISVVEPIKYCVVVPNIIPANNNQFNDNDFAVQIDPGIIDVGVTAVNTQIFRPGFETDVFVSVRNEGTTPLDSVQLRMLPISADAPVQLLEITPAPNEMIGDTLIWNNLSIELFQQNDIQLRFKTSVSGVLSSIVKLRFEVNHTGDTRLLDNTYTLCEPLLGSYDPNDKRVQPDTVPPAQLSQTDLFYTIRFQNTGTYRADFVTILDTISTDFDLSTLKVLAASHSFTWQIRNGRVLEFTFNPIYLPDSTSDEAGSHGFVQFSIRAKKDLPLGKIITNRAAIYFDYNPPIITEYANMYVENPISITKEPRPIDLISISPNPAENVVTFEKKSDTPGVLEIYSEDSKLLYRQLTRQKITNISIVDWPKGVYFAIWKTNQGSFSGKFIKSR